jgi:hypothetical protein
VFAGGWRCYRVNAEIRTNSETFKGYVELGDDFGAYLEKDLFDYLRTMSKRLNDTLKIYDTIYSLNYPKFDNHKLTAVINDKTNRVPIAEIISAELISLSPCQVWLSEKASESQEHFFSWVGHTMLISEFTIDEINRLNRKPNYETSFEYPDDEYGGFKVLSYSETLGSIEIDKIIKEFKEDIITNDGIKEKWKYRRERYKKLKVKLRSFDIIVFRLDYLP